FETLNLKSAIPESLCIPVHLFSHLQKGHCDFSPRLQSWDGITAEGPTPGGAVKKSASSQRKPPRSQRLCGEGSRIFHTFGGTTESTHYRTNSIRLTLSHRLRRIYWKRPPPSPHPIADRPRPPKIKYSKPLDNHISLIYNFDHVMDY